MYVETSRTIRVQDNDSNVRYETLRHVLHFTFAEKLTRETEIHVYVLYNAENRAIRVVWVKDNA